MQGYYRDGGKLMGHISHHVPGVEFSTGSLGHGLPVACGMAVALKQAAGGPRFSRPMGLKGGRLKRGPSASSA